jgi:hypothetical protein
MPYEIVQHGCLYCETGCRQIMTTKPGERFEHSKLDGNSPGPNQSKLGHALNHGKAIAWPLRAAHEILSSR